jgi:four helix bundle protein
MAKHHEELVCWQLARELKKEVYAFIAKPPVNRDFDFCSDIRASARSGPANIAEGFGRSTHREFAHFVSIARASLKETENHLQDAVDSGYLSTDECERLITLAQRAQRTASRLRTYLLETPDRPMARKHRSRGE